MCECMLMLFVIEWCSCIDCQEKTRWWSNVECGCDVVFRLTRIVCGVIV